MGALTMDCEDDVAVVTFDLRGESVNKFTARCVSRAVLLKTAYRTIRNRLMLHCGRCDAYL